ncbi:hypothetical protein ACFQHO_53200 [Actinomadura yumaensis]|uniref:hypothetical protein n=1 Tax=Actinomadura yumaensis TaxID=111807 RepID=UPI0036210697
MSGTRVQAPQITGIDRILTTVGQALTSLATMPFIASGVLLLAGAVAQLAGGLFALTAAAGPAVGTLALLPGLAAAAAQGLGVLLLGFGGVGKALKALTAVDQQSAQTAKKSADTRRAAAEQQRAAAEQLQAARQRLADARVNAARQVEQAERQIADAERAHVRAIENVRLAQEALNETRRQAKERLEDLALAASGAALDEEGARYALIHAKRRLQDTLDSVKSSDLDKKEADLAFRQAQQRLKEAQDANQDAAEEKRRADREGVEGNKSVEDARRRLRDANEALRDSVRGIADAERGLRDARKAGAREVADAQKGVANAMRGVASAARAQTEAMNPANAAVRNLGLAMKDLGPNARAFVMFLHGTLIPRLKLLRRNVQEAILPGIQGGVTAAMPFLDTLDTGLTRTGGVVGGLSRKFGRFLGSKSFRSDFRKIMRSNDRVIVSLANSAGSLGQALIDVMVVAAPFVERFADWIEELGDAAQKTARVNRENGDMEAFFERAWAKARLLKNIVRDVTMALVAMGRAATDQDGKKGGGDTLLQDLADAAAEFRAWANDADTQQKLRDWFTDLVPAVREFGNTCLKLIRLIAQIGDTTSGTMQGLYKVLQGVMWVLDQIMKIPGAGPVIGAIFFLSGAALGIGLLATALGRVLRVLRLLGRVSGLNRLFGGSGNDDPARRVGKLREGIDELTDSVEREIPKDRAKATEIDAIGGHADKTNKKAGKLGKGFDELGDKAEKNAKKSGKFGRALSGLSGLVLAIPGVSAFAGWANKIGARMKSALGKLGGGKGAVAAGRAQPRAGSWRGCWRRCWRCPRSAGSSARSSPGSGRSRPGSPSSSPRACSGRARRARRKAAGRAPPAARSGSSAGSAPGLPASSSTTARAAPGARSAGA